MQINWSFVSPFTNFCFSNTLIFLLFIFLQYCMHSNLLFFIFLCMLIHIYCRKFTFITIPFVLSHFASKLLKAGDMGGLFPLNFWLFNNSPLYVNNIWSIQYHAKSIGRKWWPLTLVFRVHLIDVAFCDDCNTQI